MPRSGTVGSYGNFEILFFLRVNSIMFSIVAAPVKILTNSVGGLEGLFNLFLSRYLLSKGTDG